MITSAAHCGIQHAIGSVSPARRGNAAGPTTPRTCRKPSPASEWKRVRTMFQSTINQEGPEPGGAQARAVVDMLEAKLPKAMAHLKDDGILTVTAFPRSAWTTVWSNNPTVRLHKELQRRTDVVAIIPNRDSAVRSVEAVLAEQPEDWMQQHRYTPLAVLSGTAEMLAKARETAGADGISGDGQEALVA